MEFYAVTVQWNMYEVYYKSNEINFLKLILKLTHRVQKQLI